MDLVSEGGISIDDYARSETVSVLEVYSPPGAVPAEYMTMRNGCGVIAVWTKFGTEMSRCSHPSRSGADRRAARLARAAKRGDCRYSNSNCCVVAVAFPRLALR